MKEIKKAEINGYVIREVMFKYKTVYIDMKPTGMTYTQACNWAKKVDKEKP